MEYINGIELWQALREIGYYYYTINYLYFFYKGLLSIP